MKKIIFALAIFVVLLVMLATRLYQNKSQMVSALSAPDTNMVIAVDTIVVQQSTRKIELQYIGTFEPVREIRLQPVMNGTVINVHFSEGDFVKEGSPLLHLDDDLYRAQLIGAKASYENAKTNAERFVNASKAEGVTALQVDRAQLELAIAESQLKQLEKNIGLCSYNAPFTGVITAKDVEIGSVVGAKPIGRLSDLTRLKLQIKVPEQEITNFKNRPKVQVSSDELLAEPLAGTVKYVSVRGDTEHQFEVDVLVDNKFHAIRAGSLGQVNLTVQDKRGIYIPRTVLSGSSRNAQVYLFKNGRAIQQDIVTGRSIADMIEVIKGLDEGDILITSGLINIRPNGKVAPQ